MRPVTKITFTDDNGIKFFGEGPCRLLRSVEKTGSLRTAALEMEMAYSKASKILKQAEFSLGFPLTRRSTGGKDGGGSILTPEGKQWLRQYEAYRDACVKANQALYRQYFPKIGCVIMASGLGTKFGENNNFSGSTVDGICEKFADELAKLIGSVALIEHEVDLTADDGLKDYGTVNRRVSLLTAQQYREHVYTLDKHKLDAWWWLATPFSTKAHGIEYAVKSVAPSGCVGISSCGIGSNGVRPFCILKSTIFVSK